MTGTDRLRIVDWKRGEAVYRRGIIQSGCLKGLPPAAYSEEDGEGRMVYMVAPYTSLEVWCGARDLSAAELQWLLRSLAGIWKSAEACLLPPGAFFLGPDQIFLDADKGEVKLCVRPEDARDLEDLRRTARLILEAIDYKEEACVELAYEFYHLCMKNEPSADEILAVCDGTERNVFPAGGTDEEADESIPENAAANTSERHAADTWIDIHPDPVTPEEEKRRARDDLKKRIRSAGGKILFAAAVALVAAALLKAGF